MFERLKSSFSCHAQGVQVVEAFQLSGLQILKTFKNNEVQQSSFSGGGFASRLPQIQNNRIAPLAKKKSGKANGIGSLFNLPSGIASTTKPLAVNTVYQENCLETLSRMPLGFVDLVVTSPPYDDMKSYNGYTFEFEKICQELFRVLKPGGVIVWVVGDATSKGTETGTSFRQALYFKEIGFNLHDTMIWHKSNVFNFGSNACYRQSFEYMFVFSKGKPKAGSLIKDVPSTLAGKLVKGARKHADGSRDKVPGFIVGEFKKRDNVWKMPTTSGSSLGHPATFPLQLAMDHIASWSNEGDLVYDPFMGSGTSALAAKKLNRHWLGSEISPEYVEIAQNRIASFNQTKEGLN